MYMSCVLTCNLHVVHTCTCSTYMMYAYMHTRVCHVPHVCVPHVCHIYKASYTVCARRYNCIFIKKIYNYNLFLVYV